MSPKPHVARQAGLVFLALIVLAIVGYPIVALVIAGAVLFVAAAYGSNYLRYRRKPLPDHGCAGCSTRTSG